MKVRLKRQKKVHPWYDIGIRFKLRIDRLAMDAAARQSRFVLFSMGSDESNSLDDFKPGSATVYRLFPVWRTGKPCHARRVSRKFRGIFHARDDRGGREGADNGSEGPGARRGRYEGT